MLVSLSRGGWISICVALAFCLAASIRSGLFSARRLVAFAIVGLVLAAAVGVVYPSAYLRITQRDQRATESRILMASQSLLIIRNHPLIGVGIGNYARAAEIYVPQSFASVSKEFQEQIQEGVVHNKYLLQAAETGIVGLVLLVLVCLTFLRACLRVRRWRDPTYFAIGIGIAAAIVGQLVFFLFDHFYVDVRILLLWITFGVVSGLVRMQTTGSQKDKQRGDVVPQPGS